MTDSVAIALIVGIVVVIVLVVFRKQLSSFVLKIGGLQARMKTREGSQGSTAGPASRPGGVKVSDVRMTGQQHRIAVDRGDVEVEDIRQRGIGHEIVVGRERTSQEHEDDDTTG